MVAAIEERDSAGMAFSRRRVEVEADTSAARDWLEWNEEPHRGFISLEPLNSGMKLLREIVVGNLHNWICEPSCVMVRRDSLERLGGLNPRIHQLHDQEHWLRIMASYDVAFRLWILEMLMSHLFGRSDPIERI